MITLQTQSNSGIKEECIDFSDFRKFFYVCVHMIPKADEM